jgi:hypothetical protein
MVLLVFDTELTGNDKHADHSYDAIICAIYWQFIARGVGTRFTVCHPGIASVVLPPQIAAFIYQKPSLRPPELDG